MRRVEIVNKFTEVKVVTCFFLLAAMFQKVYVSSWVKLNEVLT